MVNERTACAPGIGRRAAPLGNCVGEVTRGRAGGAPMSLVKGNGGASSR